MDKLPKTLGTMTQFKRAKRKQFKEVCAFIEASDISRGCAYLPDLEYKRLSEGISLILLARERLRPWWKNT